MSNVKPTKGSELTALLAQTSGRQEDLIIPFLDSYLTKCNNTGTYDVVNEFKADDRFFHPSGDTMKCKRLLFFEKSDRFKVPKEVYSPTTIRTFHIGQAVHSLVQVWVKKMGELKGFPFSAQGPEVLAFNEALNIKGAVDDIIKFPLSGKTYVLEIKSINSAKFSLLSAPMVAHQMQVKIYCHVKGIDSGIVLYVQKDYPHAMKEYKVEKGDITSILTRWGRIQESLIADDCSGLEWECKDGDKTFGKCPCRGFCRTVER